MASSSSTAYSYSSGSTVLAPDPGGSAPALAQCHRPGGGRMAGAGARGSAAVGAATATTRHGEAGLSVFSDLSVAIL